MRCAPIILLPALLLAGCWKPPAAEAIPRLQLLRALPVDAPGDVEPSGLAWHAGVLYTVCDKTDDTIFRLDLSGDTARMIPHLRFRPPSRGPMDFEGITIDGAGNFFLASEFHSRVLWVRPDGATRWLTGDIKVVAHNAGMLVKYNAGLEGLALLPDGDILLAAEREQRGFIRVAGLRGEGVLRAAGATNQTRFTQALALWRIADYSGLATDNGRVFALFRNAHLVVELEPDGELFRESPRAWSYAHIENDPRYAYREERFGQAEGLAVHGDTVYLIVDNNRSPRRADPADRRPQLWIMEMTDGE
jgi:hypothetical protein